MTWSAYVALAFNEIRLAGVRSPQVTRRLVAVLEDLRSIAPADRRAPLEAQLKRLRAAVEASVDREDVPLFLGGDGAGLGVAAGDAG
jgi:uncharacterized membrane protein